MEEIKDLKSFFDFEKLKNTEYEEHQRKVEQYEQEEKRLLEQKQVKQRLAYYHECNIEPEFYEKTISDYIPKTETQTKAKKIVEEIIKNKTGQLVLLGEHGLGKTMLASIATMALCGRLYSMYEISTMIRQSYTIRAERTELEIVNELAKTPFLAIDELGRTKGGDAEQNWLSYVLDKRHVRKLPFMLISNGHFKKKCPNKGCAMCFENFVNNDILSRLRERAHFIVVDGPDERLKKRQELV